MHTQTLHYSKDTKTVVESVLQSVSYRNSLKTGPHDKAIKIYSNVFLNVLVL